MLGLASMRVGESTNDWSLHDSVCCDLLRERELESRRGLALRLRR